jgi:hypothetical protein
MATSSAKISSANWMAGIPDRTRLFDLYIPGTHDSATGYYKRPNQPDIGWLPASAVMTQDKLATFKTQLEKGIRYFDLRFNRYSYGPSIADRWKGAPLEPLEVDPILEYRLYHGDYSVDVTLKEAVDEIKSFLEQNPTEIVFVSLQPASNHVVTPSNIREHIFNYAKTNTKLPTYSELEYSEAGIKFPEFPAPPNNLWIEGHKDFDTIRLLRPYRGLGNLGKKFNLTTGDYKDNVAIKDPKENVKKIENGIEKVTYVNPKLDYSGLAVGDVRGRIVLVESNFQGYPGYGWSNPEITSEPVKPSEKGVAVDPLDRQGTFSTGSVAQDNSEAPAYQTKKNDIYNFAKLSTYTRNSTDGVDRSLPLNFTSASPAGIFSSGLRDAPATFALVVGSGGLKEKYTTDGSSTVVSMLNRSALDSRGDDGPLAAYNLKSKLNATGPGLKGVMLGDFFTTSFAWYNEFWDGGGWYDRGGKRPNVNSGDYPASDWLTQKIWRQSAVITPLLSVPNDKRDAVTGLLTVKEGESIDLGWVDYLAGIPRSVDRIINKPLNITHYDSDNPNDKLNWSLNYKVTQVNPAELGLSSTDKRDLGAKSSTIFVKRDTRAKKMFEKAGDAIKKGFDRNRYENISNEQYAIQQMAGDQGDRFFKIDLLASSDGTVWNIVGAPTYFMVSNA